MARTYLCIDRTTGRIAGSWGPSFAAPPPPSDDHVFVDAETVVGLTPYDRLDNLAPVEGDDRGLYTGTVVIGNRPVVRKKLTRFEFMSLLTAAELDALDARAQSDPEMRRALRLLEVATHVEIGHPFLTQMLGYVQAVGIMTAERRAAFEAAMVATAK